MALQETPISEGWRRSRKVGPEYSGPREVTKITVVRRLGERGLLPKAQSVIAAAADPEGIPLRPYWEAVGRIKVENADVKAIVDAIVAGTKYTRDEILADDPLV